jgi:hypothetical protein
MICCQHVPRSIERAAPTSAPLKGSAPPKITEDIFALEETERT